MDPVISGTRNHVLALIYKAVIDKENISSKYSEFDEINPYRKCTHVNQ